MKDFLGIPYPVKKTPLGFFYSQGGIDQIKSDMLVLLLTNPGERVMNLNYGTPLRQLFFEPNDPTVQLQARNIIINSIKKWEPRVAIRNIVVKPVDQSQLNSQDKRTEKEYILFVQIIFVDPQNIKQVQELTLEVPLSGGT